MRPVIILIRQRECAGGPKSALGSHVRRYIFWRNGSHTGQSGLAGRASALGPGGWSYGITIGTVSRYKNKTIQI